MKRPAKKRKAKVSKSITRIYVPDSHGEHIDLAAEAAFLRDVEALDPDHMVMLGDHVDAGGTFSGHQRSYTNEMTESYEDDCAAANRLLDEIARRAPRISAWDYIEGNHEQHVERWAARELSSKKDADALLEVLSPAAKLSLKKRGIKYYKRSEHYSFNGQTLAIPGTIKLGKVFATHGISASKNAAAVHVERFGGSVRFGHIHRRQTFGTRTVTSPALEAACPGTLAKLQPLYRHTVPTGWGHGYGLEFVNPSGNFLYINVPIFDGVSALLDLVGRVRAA